MSDADFGPSVHGNNGIDWNNADRTVGMVNFQDRNAHAIFYTAPMHNPAKSREAGRPISDDVVMIRIGNPGERLNVVIRPATQQDKQRFALQWAQFQQNRVQKPEGSPISLLFPESPATVANLEGCGVYTVEQLAGLSGDAIQSIGMGAQGWVNNAQTYLANAEKGIRNSQMRQAQEEHDREMNAIKFQLAEAQKTIEKLVQQNKAIMARQGDIALAGGMEHPVHIGQGFDPQAEQIAALGRESRPAPQKQRRPRTSLRG